MQNPIDIAIVGMACRFPGAAGYDQYWQNLIARKNCISEVPADRWDWRALFGDPKTEPNKTNVKWGGFIDDVDKFDPLFFGIAPNEAAFVDPQHRLFLETAWHAVEDAGYSIASLAGRPIGVYAGVSKNDYAESMRESRYEIAPYLSTGTVHSILANRVSFLFNLTGRSEVVDTACSSSLVALHNAIRDIQNGECEAAIVGGVNALLSPTMFISHSKSGMLAPDGQCKTFSASADGYVRSEGVGVLFIKTLERAVADGDFIHAVIKSSAISHGGRSNFLTSPTTEAQAAVVMRALARGGIDPKTIDYIETHGTGTPLGDPIEINGLKRAFAQLGEERADAPHCALSAVKTNVGHLESAAGMAGIIKVVMAMRHRTIPAIRNFDRLNPYIELDGSPFFIATEHVDWQANGHPRRAGVSSFGMGGVNAHVVLEEPPQRDARESVAGEFVFPLSAKKGRLKAYAQSLADFLDRNDDVRLEDVAFTLQHGRDAFEERIAIRASSKDELRAKLLELSGDDAEVVPAEGRRIPLPAYPFARRRCWFTDVPSRVTAEVAPKPAQRRLSAADFFIRDHVVQGRAMLPGVAHLEFARAAKPDVRALKDVYWMTPVVVESDASVEIRLTSQNGFELVSNGTVHSKGTLADAAPESRTIDLDTIRVRCTPGTSKAELYALLKEHGLAYGSTFQVIEQYASNARELVAELQLPADANGDFVLHPSVMDGIFQSITALSIAGLGETTRQFVPFHLESIEIAKPTASRCFVHATVRDAKTFAFDAVLTDEQGSVLVEIRNLQKRPIGEKRELDTFYRPIWREQAIAPRPLDRPILWNPAADALESGSAVAWRGTNELRDLHDLLAFTQSAFAARVRELRLAYLHTPGPIGAAVAGFARTLKYENPKFDFVSVEVEDLNAIDDIAAMELAHAPNANALREVAYRGGRRFERTVVADSLKTATAAPVLRRNGVYVISGGAGGLGAIFSRHLASHYDATILWLGRSPMSDAIAQKIETIGRCEYYTADITDRESLATAFAAIKAKHSEIHGVIHAAGLIEDAFILHKTPESFARVIEPKIIGAQNLDALTANEPLDFFAVFSSIAALMPNQGQCDYAAANSYLDAFIEERQRRGPGLSLAINWPLWANGGMRVSPEEERHLLRVFGMKPLPSGDGIALFESALALAKSRNLPQVIALDGDREKIERSLGVAVANDIESLLKSLFAARLRVSAANVDANRTIGELGIDSTAVLGITNDVNQRFGADVKPTLLFDINTVGKLAAHLTAIGKDQPLTPAAPRWNRSLIDADRSDAQNRVFQRTFRTDEFYLRDHVVDGQYNMPGACYVEMARQAGDLLLGDKAVRRLLHNYWASPLSSPREDFTAYVHLTPKQDHYAYEVVSYEPSGEKRLHAMGDLWSAATPVAAVSHDLDAIRARCDETQFPERIYEQIHGEGLIVGRTFLPMQRIVLSDNEALAELVLSDEVRADVEDYVLHPALLTGAFQCALIGNRREEGNARKYIPIGMDELEILDSIPADCVIYSRPRAANARNEEVRKFDVDICRTDGTVVVRLKGFSIRALRIGSAAAPPQLSKAEALPPHSKEGDVRSYLRELIAGPIGLPADEIDFESGFDQYGVNSVMVVELNQIFENIFGPLSKTLFFEYRSVDELAGYFLEEHREKLLSAVPATREAEPQPQIVIEDRHDIAIVSAAGRFPGARDLKEFWTVLRDGRDCITEIPRDRFDYKRHYDADPERNGIYAKWGGFIDDADKFDPLFFNISPSEAELIDPQERLLLEMVWDLLERSGYTRQRLHKLSDRRVGVFVGALWQPYESLGVEATMNGNPVGPSSLLYSIANRVSYFFDLSGPSMAVDTACSSSLTALHLACQSIRDGESRFAIAAGVNLSASASKYLFLSRFRFLSTDGRCRSYGAGGDGYVPGEGVCALLLKPLSNAIADGDSILGVIHGSALNHGGRTNGYTVPNPKSQGSVIAQALEQSRIDPQTITYIEGHGTGTSLGDPIEISGLEKALGRSDRKVAIGSVKSNIGHLEAAAGLASLIKVLLQIEHKQLAPSIHSDALNPNIDFERGLFRVQRELGPWQEPRCAGVSSFGAGGSNAHVILSEYTGAPAPTLRGRTGPALCVFSARTEERLGVVVGQQIAFLREAKNEQLHEIAYTLQLGREGMRERVAIVANSVDELRDALQNARWIRGRAEKGARNDFETTDLATLADVWVRGGDVQWERLYERDDYAFLPMPTYPFVRERYWIDVAAKSDSPRLLHPLVHEDVSTPNEQRYRSSFTGDEFFFADHQVRIDGRAWQRVLPGVASLEMARAAIEHAVPARPDGSVLELRNVVWAQPIVSGVAKDNKDITIELTGAGVDLIDYRIVSGDTVHCQGRAAWVPRPQLDRVYLGTIGSQIVDSSRVYDAHVATGVIQGPSFQAVTSVDQGREQSLASLQLPQLVESTLGEYVLHPALMDSALQPYLGLTDGWSRISQTTRMPFALESLTVLGPCTRRMFAWMRFAPGSTAQDAVTRLDVDLCDEEGNVCVRMRGFAVRAVRKAQAAESAGLTTLAPVWDVVDADAQELRPRANERVLVIGGDDEQRRALREECGAELVDAIDAHIDHIVWILPAGETDFIDAQERGVLRGFRAVKSLLERGYGTNELAWTIVTPDDAAQASVEGFVGSLAKEHRNWKVRLVAVDGAIPWNELLRLGFDERGDGWAYRNGQWSRRRLVTIEPAAPASAAFRRNGVYVVIGGAGGVGEVLTSHLIRNYDARVAWIGRRALDADIEAKLARVSVNGERPLYFAADARHRDELQRAADAIKQRYGRIDGVIHSAIVLSDKSLANMSEEQFRAALSVKVDASVRIDEVFGREPLDFILYFSSLMSDLKAAGQSNYAAGCTFTDAFAAWQSARGAYPVKVMNWGYWGGVGIVAAAEYQERMARMGWGSIEADEGMAAVEQLLRGPLDRAGVIRLKHADALRTLNVKICDAQAVPQEWEARRSEFDALLARVLRGQMNALGANVVPAYDRWLRETQRVLANAGEALTLDDWQREKERFDVAEVRLADAALQNLLPILRGDKRATDILFPSSSLELVGAVYKNNTVADHFNRGMADVVAQYVSDRRRNGAAPLRLIELGAGTGGSSDGILRRLDAHRKDVAEYCYTDVSKWFLVHGEQAYGANREHLKFAVVDVEKPLEAQGIEPGAYDVVLAANVLHATRRMRDTLRHAKSALKENGILVLNEIGASSVFMHLTFGLLEGWWAYEDPQLRIEGSPGLSAESWQRVLEETGFRKVAFPAQGVGRLLIVAESDGVRSRSAAAPAAALEAIEQWLVDAIGVLLKVKREHVDLDAELGEFGFDSISLTGLANYVNEAFALELMPTVFFEHPTVRRFAKHLVEKHNDKLVAKFGTSTTTTTTTAPAPKPAPQPVKRVEAQPTIANDAIAIAIIGMSGRFPGADDLDAFWENLVAGRESVREIPRERWDWRAFDGSEKGGGRWGSFIDGVDRFDPLFFGISPREAERMDPQHRLAMMFGWKAFEDAGYGPKQLWGSRTGVFVGTTGTGYADLLLSDDGSSIEGYTATGLVPSVGPNRISFLLNLHGPSEPIETACSSALVAVHRAMRSILAGECDLALAGGVNTLFPTLHTSFNKSGMLSPDGKCKTFSAQADGYARGEGVGMIVLKKLSDAERDGDHVYALIRGSAENHGGRAQSLTAPNPNAQSELIQDAYRRAGISPRTISYIEAHGTGTPLGDPIEINGLKTAFQTLAAERNETPQTNYCGLGSVKTNIGHLELAAGIAGLIKIVLQLRHETLVRSLHCEEVNPYIRLEDSPFYIVQENRPWPRLGDAPRRAGISSFGFGGVNAHVVLEEYAAAPAARTQAGPAMIVLSARDATRLREQAAQLRQWIARNGDADLASVAYTLQVGREAMEHRLALTVSSLEELSSKLEAFVADKPVDGLQRGEVKRGNETLALFRDDEELREAVAKWMQRGKWAKLLELWVRGLDVEWEQLYGDARPRRVSLPAYPFAQERCWVDAPLRRTQTALASVLHPLLHRNTSDFTAQRYTSQFDGRELFLSDHRVSSRKVLPGAAYLEMARAAIKQAMPNHDASILELRDTSWLAPIVVSQPTDVSIVLTPVDDDCIDYEIRSDAALHCQGQAVFVPRGTPVRLDVDALRRELSTTRNADDLYAAFSRLGLDYGPAHRGITSLHIGEGRVLAQLHLPACVEASAHEYVLHPSLLDSTLQASVPLLADLDLAGKPPVPFGLAALRILAPPSRDLFAWVRRTSGGTIDIDLCDANGNVCVELRGLAARVMDAAVPDNTFDDAFYESLVADIASHRVSASEAADLE